MAEGLSPEDAKKAKKFASSEWENAHELEGLGRYAEGKNKEYDEVKSELGSAKNITVENALNAKLKSLQKEAGAYQNDLQQASDRRDANLWQAHQHKEAHLDDYIETAKQEAEADGKEINLQTPETPDEPK